MGTKEELNAPSAKIRLKKLGILMAITSASIIKLVPMYCAIRMSRKNPVTRLRIVKKATLRAEETKRILFSSYKMHCATHKNTKAAQLQN